MEYKKLDSDVAMVFALSPEFKERPRIFEYWQNLINLHNIPTFTPEARRVTNLLSNKLRISDFSSIEDLYQFVRNLEIAPGDTDSHDNPDDPYSDIEDKAIQKVRDICGGTHFQAGATEPELPCEILYYDLIYTCQKGAGSNADIYPDLKDKILKFIGRRKMPSHKEFGFWMLFLIPLGMMGALWLEGERIEKFWWLYLILWILALGTLFEKYFKRS